MAQSCDRIVHNLRALGITVDVVHFMRGEGAARIESKRGGRYIGHPLGDDPSHGLNTLWNFLEADPGRSTLTHVVAFGGVVPLLAGPLFSAWLGVPLVTLFRGNDFDTGIFSPKRSDIVRFAIERSTRICVVSRDKERRINALFPDARATWIPNGIDLSGWEPLPSDHERAAAWRAEHVEPGRRVLGMIGHIKRKKGGVLLLESLLASGYAERFHLLFVGELDEGVCAILDECGDQLRYSIYPFADRYELLALYPACDLVAIPSFYDGLPNVLLEAASLGIPLLASTAGGMGDLLVDGRHGYLFAPGDRHGCREAIVRAAIAPEEELKRFGDECRALIRSRYDHLTEAKEYRRMLLESIPPTALPNGSEKSTPEPDIEVEQRTRHSIGEER